ncbi:nitrite reductase/ring-hydroxylating ferredoxin subunit [Pseudomonas sp. SJZ079]|uniref:Rieske (2Fe-2S) protein n=1 Tax=Pseudomonas sp. SJZ079 TaxID=2572887 RepID=UPI00119C3EE4|nr:Rieske 2Fe-2S domain-containing protein [Pseudomonas sp. SJZ079]TWC30569.1 nitrite reductase/ring-hydroxylating ferredoxin subunit [Pseudomonas sp. SJZ079]
MNTRIEVDPQRQPAPGGRVLIQGEGSSITLFNLDGRFYAIDDSCPHPAASLCGGRLQGRVIQCGAHGLRLDLASGYPLNSTQLKVASYPVEVLDGRLFIIIASEESAS